MRFLGIGTAIVLLNLAGTGCSVTVDHGDKEDGAKTADSGNHETRTEKKSVPKDKAEQVSVEVEMGAGELAISGGSTHLMDGTFVYNRDAFKPDIRYEGSNFRGTLSIKHQGGRTNLGGDVKNEWDVRLANDVPVDITVKLGAGENKLDLGQLNLRNVEVNLGAGKCDMDLRGNPRHSYQVVIRGGVGEATVRVPKDVGVFAEAKGGLGEVNVRGLHQDGKNTYRNDAYGKSKESIRLDIKGGIGQINIYSE